MSKQCRHLNLKCPQHIRTYPSLLPTPLQYHTRRYSDYMHITHVRYYIRISTARDEYNLQLIAEI